MANENVTSVHEVATSLGEVEGKLRRGCADMTALCQGNMGAAVASGQAAVCGVQEITGALLAFVQSRVKDGLTAGQQFAASASPEAAVEIQLEYSKAMLQAWTDEYARLSALTGRIMADVVTPPRRRAVAAAETSNHTGALAA